MKEVLDLLELDRGEDLSPNWEVAGWTFRWYTSNIEQDANLLKPTQPPAHGGTADE